MIRSILPVFAFGALFVATPALADTKICIIDTEQAMNETGEGKAAQAKLESMYTGKQAEIERLQADLEKQLTDYEARKMILSESARADQERVLAEKQRAFQAMVVQSEEEMQNTYAQLLQGMQDKLLRVAPTVAARKACSVMLQKEATVYVGPDVLDLTHDVIAELDKAR